MRMHANLVFSCGLLEAGTGIVLYCDCWIWCWIHILLIRYDMYWNSFNNFVVCNVTCGAHALATESGVSRSLAHADWKAATGTLCRSCESMATWYAPVYYLLFIIVVLHAGMVGMLSVMCRQCMGVRDHRSYLCHRYVNTGSSYVYCINLIECLVATLMYCDRCLDYRGL